VEKSGGEHGGILMAPIEDPVSASSLEMNNTGPVIETG
jgi:hypothetical protein